MVLMATTEKPYGNYHTHIFVRKKKKKSVVVRMIAGGSKKFVLKTISMHACLLAWGTNQHLQLQTSLLSVYFGP